MTFSVSSGVLLASVLGAVLWKRGGSPQPIPIFLTCSASEAPGISNKFPSWPFNGEWFLPLSGSGDRSWFPYVRGLGLRLWLDPPHVAPPEKGEIAMSFTLPAGVRPLRLVAWTVVRSYRCSRVGSHQKFELRGCTFTTNCRRWDVCLSRFRRCARHVLDGRKFVRRFQSSERWRRCNSTCLLELSGYSFRQHHDSSSRGWRSRVCGRRTRAVLDCRASALGALSVCRCRARRKDGDFAWNSANHWDFRWRSCRSTRDLESRESRSRAPRGGRGHSSAPRAEPAASIQLHMSEELRSIGSRINSTGTANSRATSHNTEFNVLGCSQDIATRCGPHKRCDSQVWGRGPGPSQRQQGSCRFRSAEHSPESAPLGLESSLSSLAMVLGVQEAAGSSRSRSRVQPRGHFRRWRGGVRLAHRRRAGTRWPWRSRRAPCREDRDVVAYHSDKRDPPRSDHPIPREESQGRNASLGWRGLVVPTLCGESFF